MKAITVQISTYWWDEKEQRDIPSNSIEVTIWSPISMATARAFSHNCHTPEELWNYLHDLNTDKDKILREEFGHIPSTNTTSLPANLNELFQ